MVVVYHFDAIHLALTGTHYVRTLRYFGYIGVDLFFAISGAIMFHVGAGLHSGRDAARFLYHRLARIYPIYWLCLLVMVIWHILFTNELANASMVQNLLLLPSGRYLNPIAWTLTYELFFYLFFAGLILLPRRWFGPLLIGTACAIAALTVLGLSRALHPHFGLAFMLEFLGGCGAAALALRHGGRYGGLALCLAAGIVAGAIVGQWRYDRILGNFENWRILVFGSAAVIATYAAIALEISRRLVAPRLLARGGDWSYSIYLFQLVFVWASAWILSADSTFPIAFRTVGLTGVVVAEVLMAIVISKYLELPFYRFLKQAGDGFFLRRPSRSVS